MWSYLINSHVGKILLTYDIVRSVTVFAMQHGNNTSFLFLVIFQNGRGTGLDSAQDELVDSKSQKCYDLLVKKKT